MREDGLCRVRFFINNQREIICVLTDIDDMSNAPYLDSICDTVINLLYENGHLLKCDCFVLHDEFDSSMAIIEKNGNINKPISKRELELLTECEEQEFAYKSMNIAEIRNQIEKKRYEINPFINNRYLQSPSYIKHEIEIQENAVSKKMLKALIDEGAVERELDNLVKKDLSLIGGIYGHPHDEYIVFSEFPLGDKRVDFAIFSSR